MIIAKSKSQILQYQEALFSQTSHNKFVRIHICNFSVQVKKKLGIQLKIWSQPLSWWISLYIPYFEGTYIIFPLDGWRAVANAAVAILFDSGVPVDAALMTDERVVIESSPQHCRRRWTDEATTRNTATGAGICQHTIRRLVVFNNHDTFNIYVEQEMPTNCGN